MIGIFSFLLIFAGIGIIGGAIWIWKYKNWSNIKKAVLTIILVAGLAAVYASFGLFLMPSGQAEYSTSGSNLGEIDYDKIISNAKNAGYVVHVNTKNTIGMHPQNIKELDERLGDDYRIVLVNFYLTEDTGFDATLPKKPDDETKIRFFNISESRYDRGFLAPFELKHLPSDEWIIERFKLMFGLDEQKAQHYLAQLKDSINRDQEPEILIKETPDLLAVYNYFKETSSNSTLSLTLGAGTCKETFYKGNETIGTIPYTIPNARITLQDNGHEYSINIDRLGGVAPYIILSDKEQKIPEEEYRRIFKDMFTDLGLPAEKVDEFEFSRQQF
ncbi:MAG: hypothetical protein C5S44_01515 [Candidatus Methanocomedens sp.]|nr:MAG: hypothetical protein C5S44_01515 [ANME-2 cluster archaeon]